MTEWTRVIEAHEHTVESLGLHVFFILTVFSNATRFYCDNMAKLTSSDIYDILSSRKNSQKFVSQFDKRIFIKISKNSSLLLFRNKPSNFWSFFVARN